MTPKLERRLSSIERGVHYLLTGKEHRNPYATVVHDEDGLHKLSRPGIYYGTMLSVGTAGVAVTVTYAVETLRALEYLLGDLNEDTILPYPAPRIAIGPLALWSYRARWQVRLRKGRRVLLQPNEQPASTPTLVEP